MQLDGLKKRIRKFALAERIFFNQGEPYKVGRDIKAT